MTITFTNEICIFVLKFLIFFQQEIDILWTGPKVISKHLTVESIQEVTEVLRRPPVIWDNLHANDYDQKRVFLGPYAGRSPELIPLLRGVLTNPNCEFHANQIAIHTLAHWSKCDSDTRINCKYTQCNCKMMDISLFFSIKLKNVHFRLNFGGY